MKRDRCLLSVAVILVTSVSAAIYLLPPIAFCKGGICYGKKTEYSKTPANHIYESEFILSDPNYHKTTDFDNFYFLNLRFWEKLDITEIEYGDKIQQPEIDSLTPFIYSVEQNKKGKELNSFQVNRGSDWWYFDYYYAPF